MSKPNPKCPLVQKAYKAYPNPTEAHTTGGDPGCYCVGGALYLALAEPKNIRRVHSVNRFPAPFSLAILLRRINPNLDYGNSVEYANDIVTANDTGEFNKAWEKADEACSWQPRKV